MSLCKLNENDARDLLRQSTTSPCFNENFFVEAGAGAGKTQVTVERIVNQLMSGACAPEEAVAITFTEKATGEMRGRLDDAQLARQQEALAKGEFAKAAKANEIRAALGRMQISTIHGFSKTLLQTMPFEAGLGMEPEVVEDDSPYAKAFYQRKCKEEPAQFAAIQALGVAPWQLEDAFVSLCMAGDSEIAFIPPSDPIMKQKAVFLDWKAREVHAELRDAAIAGKVSYKKCKTPLRPILDAQGNIIHPDAQMLAPEMLAFLQDPAPPVETLRRCVAKLMRSDKNLLRKYGADAHEMRKYTQAKKADVPLGYAQKHPLFDYVKMLKNYRTYQTKSAISPMKELDPFLKSLTHSTVVALFLPWVGEYHSEKAAANRLDFNDLLLRARDLLRDNAQARQYFHQKYRTIYLDEFQDTDSVQIELLFYLTDESNYLETCQAQGVPPDWKMCKPRAGSLFLVGDPKQAIYRFRGADIDSYNQVKERFLGDGTPANAGIGQVVMLQNNYRSDAAICDFVEKSFSPASPTVGARFFRQSAQQAGYTAMHAVRGNTGVGAVSHYLAQGGTAEQTRSNDAGFVAKTIAEMVANKVMVGTNPSTQHPAQYDDFLVLTYNKSAVERYVASLADLGIPSVSSGDRHLGNTRAIQHGLAHLDVLANPGNGAKLVALLHTCYGVSLPVIRRFLACSQGKLVYALYSPETLAAVRAQASGPVPDAALCALCDVGELLAQLMQRAKNQPPMAVLEYLFDGGFQLWQQGDARTLREEYAMVQQFLNGVRHGAKGRLADYCAFAAQYATKGLEHQLLLEPTSNCVRVMNLHKAKGLEGNVVFLTASSETAPKVYQHVARQNGKSVLYSCITSASSGQGSFGTTVYGTPPDWEDDDSSGVKIAGKKTIEEEYLAAEALRLNYVAATRAETQLILSGGLKVSQSATKGAEPAIDTRWHNLYEQCLDQRNAGLYPDLMAVPPAPTAPAVRSAAVPTGAQANGTLPAAAAPAPVAAHPTMQALWQKETALRMAGAACSVPKRYAISPSKLDHAAPRAQKQEQTPLAANAGAVASIAQGAVMVVPAMQPAVSSALHSPYGPDWGTIVHRAMERAVRMSCHDAAALSEYAQQAVAEAFPGGVLTAVQAKCLFGVPFTRLTSQYADWLRDQVAAALGFVCKSLQGAFPTATLYPELSFFASVQAGDLYNHLKQHLQGAQVKLRASVESFDVQGYIDLAVLTDQGWLVVDYKTDRLHQDETKAQYRTRLAQEYRNQVSAYGLLLAQATGKPVVGCMLCAIPLQGEMIAL